MEAGDDIRTPQPGWARALGVVGLVAHVVVGYFYLTAGLVVPGAWLVVFLIVWAALLVVAIRLLGRRPLMVLLVPVGALALLIGGVSLGEAVLGWTA